MRLRVYSATATAAAWPDVFRTGIPADDPSRDLSFKPADLFKSYPYPVSDESRDIAIVSAFIKHHPEPMRFLHEVSRILRPGGIAVLLDPRPYVVRVGQLIGKFSFNYNPSVWSRASMEELIRRHDLPLATLSYVRYWIAPTGGLYRRGVERFFPGWIRWRIAMHQCLVLKRMPDAGRAPRPAISIQQVG